MAKSIRNARRSRRLRARLLIAETSVPKIALKHKAKVSTVYAVLNGTRTGERTPAVLAAVEEIRSV